MPAGMAVVGIAGLSARGRALGARLRSAGWRVLGFDPDVEAAGTSGIRTVGSAEQLARDCELVLVAADGEEAEGLIRALTGGTVALCGALDPRRVAALAQACAAFVDAPIDGGEEAIAAGQATIFAAGSDDAIEACRPVLQALGSLVTTGEAGSAQMARTVNDLLRWASVLAIHDAFSLVQAVGAEPSPIREAVLRASGSNRALEEWGREGLAGAREDARAALLLAQETGATMPFLEQLDALLARLDPDEMAGLFNLGIVDLSPHAAEPPPADDEPDFPAFDEPPAEEPAEAEEPLS